MKKEIIATKVGMTQVFDEDGTLTPVTVLQAGPCVVTQVKTVENDGYEANQIYLYEYPYALYLVDDNISNLLDYFYVKFLGGIF